MPTDPTAKPRVALFITCLTDQFFPRVGIATVKLLEHFGVQVDFPDAQTCCGQPFFNAGFHDDARDLAERFIEIFEPYSHVITPSGSCCAMVREHFHELLHHDPAWSVRMDRVRNKTYELVEYLTRVLKVDFSAYKLPGPEKCTYHYTCHLRSIGVKDEGQRLLAEVGNVELVPLERTEQCCGFGGTFAVKYPEISGSIVQDKIDNIRKTGATTTICNDAGCTMNIAGMCHRHGVNTRVRHLAEVLAEAVGLDCEKW